MLLLIINFVSELMTQLILSFETFFKYFRKKYSQTFVDPLKF
jgi:hypothetical protein